MISLFIEICVLERPIRLSDPEDGSLQLVVVELLSVFSFSNQISD